MSSAVDLDPTIAARPAHRLAQPAGARCLVRPHFDLGLGFGRADRPALMGHHDGLAVLQSLEGVVAHVAPHVFTELPNPEASL